MIDSSSGYIEIVEQLACGEIQDPTIPEAVSRAIVLMEPLCHRVANRYRNYAGLTWNVDHEDLYQIVRTVEAKMLSRVASRTKMALEWVETWEASTFVRARSAISTYADSGAVTGMSGHTSTARRQRSLSRFRDEMEMAQADLISADQLLEEYNTYVAKSRSNPRKQSAFAVEADIVAPTKLVPTAPDTLTDPQYVDPTTTVDVSDTIQRVLRRCKKEDPTLHQVAVVWLGWFPDGDQKSAAQVASSLGVSQSTAGRYIARVKEIASSELSEEPPVGATNYP